ncbi:MAG: hypothetical protein ACLFQX_04075 [Candidatus Kapaibacterium sp.]
MSTTIFEALQNADMNLQNADKAPLFLSLAQAQLHNAVALLEKGYGLDAEIDPLLMEHECVEEVPENESEDM